MHDEIFALDTYNVRNFIFHRHFHRLFNCESFLCSGRGRHKVSMIYTLTGHRCVSDSGWTQHETGRRLFWLMNPKPEGSACDLRSTFPYFNRIEILISVIKQTSSVIFHTQRLIAVHDFAAGRTSSHFSFAAIHGIETKCLSHFLDTPLCAAENSRLTRLCSAKLQKCYE